VTKRAGDVQENITRLEVDNLISAGISWRKLAPDLVPLFEEHSARIERDKSIEQWYGMEPMERAIIIAQRRIEIAMKNHQSDAEAKAAKRKTPRKK